jgi:hypothetical protein
MLLLGCNRKEPAPVAASNKSASSDKVKTPSLYKPVRPGQVDGTGAESNLPAGAPPSTSKDLPSTKGTESDAAVPKEGDPIKMSLDYAKAVYERDMDELRKDVGKFFDHRLAAARTEAKAAEDALEAQKKGLAKAAGEYFDKREEDARQDGNKKLVDQIKRERAAFAANGALPESIPAMLAALRMSLLKAQEAALVALGPVTEIERERKLFAEQGLLPTSLPEGIKQIAQNLRASRRAAYELAVKEYTRARKDDAAAAVERDLEKLEPASEPTKTEAPLNPFSVPGMVGRSGATKDKLLKSGGGNSESEAAVARGLAWLARMQLKDGSWEFDGPNKDKVASTGLALLPFLAAGETHKYGRTYRKNVESGINWLMARLQSSGSFGTQDMVSHAIATEALCEAAGMTKDPLVKARATQAVMYILGAQGRNGSWGYTGSSPSEGDVYSTGWQVPALFSAKLAEIKFERDRAYRGANKFLEIASTDAGSQYGYWEKDRSLTLTPAGLLSRYYLYELNPRHPAFGRGVEFLIKSPPRRDYFDMYYYYYATQVVHLYEGPDWHKSWNPKMRDLLVDLQIKGGSGNLAGSWDRDNGHIGSNYGRLGTTCLALLTLEVYYRYLPLYKRDNGGLAELEK